MSARDRIDRALCEAGICLAMRDDMLDAFAEEVSVPVLRDEFAKAALTGLLAGGAVNFERGGLASLAYEHADAMLTARSTR